MQLRSYAAILRRFWPLIVSLPLVVGVLSLGLRLAQPPRYGAVARIMVTQPYHAQQPGKTVPFADVNITHSWESSEFVLDDLPQVVASRAFADDVSAWLAQQNYPVVSPFVIQGSLDAENFHRSVTLSARADTPDTAAHLLEGAIANLQANGLAYWGYAVEEGNEHNSLNVALLDPPTPTGTLNSPRQVALDVGLRAALALAAGGGLAFLLAYLDTTVRDARQAEIWTETPVIGVIPEE